MSLEERIARLEEKTEQLEDKAVQNEFQLRDIDKKVTELTNTFLKHKGFIGGVIFTVSALWAILLVVVDIFWKKQ